MSLTTAPPLTTATGTLRRTLRWLVSFAGFPLGGLAAMIVVGPVDDAAAAVLGGLLTGVILGAVQSWGLGLPLRDGVAWTGVTALGLAIGLALGSGVVDHATALRDLVLQGAVCGAVVGLAQGALLVRRVGALAGVWPVWLAAAWATGWAVTTAARVQVEKQFTVFGAAGAVTVAALTLVLPFALARAGRRS